MPLLAIETSVASVSPAFLKELSAELARVLQKPESYVMVTLTRPGVMLFAGSLDPSCFAALRSIGRFAPAQTKELSKLLCDRLSTGLGVPPERIYLEFVDAQGYLWGHNGDTFA